ncbi:helicase-exonuclease AddAB subunit AddA [Butyrivibrio sp. FCS006]|uniref:helicase-exonuclease AddAB subunit AddA n=1 Tax=Butyrivibrio sp. FCS006 TaxID=1280684 RepID=UPI0003FEF919|nr:helicase-exonuclease AddAB subunit AddA [Butyrivibrio sp. FCS006]
MGVEFTKEQQAVIDARDCNILVSAAAGSGKTAVLVERIIGMVLAGLDVDHLLVVTFTKAAAAQMKEKITAAIQEKLAQDPDNEHLQKQETLIHNAQITTIDSFCQYVIRNNFNTIGLDPSFRVADEGELKLLQEEVMSSMIEEEYEAAKQASDSDFIFFMDYFSQGSRDERAVEFINDLFKFSVSCAWPEEWIRERASDYELSDEAFDELPWVKECMRYAKSTLKECADKIDRAYRMCLEPDGPYMYGDQLETENDSIYAALRYDTYDALFDGLRGISFDRLSTKRDPSVNADKRELAKDLRGDVKDRIGKLITDYFALPSEAVLANMQLCDRAVKELCRLTLEFKSRFDELKRERQIIDFSDMEHFALQILVDPDTKEPTQVALEYRDYYKEVLIDEYQDSNNVQEMILKAISGEEAAGSERFMVGDVKQSIYKFRLARPEIFMEKFRSYDRDEKASDRRIDLHKNFRSRSEVLDITNYIFKRLMAGDLGGVEYDEDARLVRGRDFEEPDFDVTPEMIFIDGADTLDEDSPDEEGIGDMSSKEKEALFIAERINKLREENSALMFKDIVILLRAPSGWDETFKDVLEGQGIPTYIDSKSGYLDASEVAILLDSLSVIDNPRQDVPLTAVMHSSIGGFSDEELALIRIAMNKSEEQLRGETIYDGLISDLELSDGLSAKVKAFTDTLEEYRRMSTYTPVHDLLQIIIDDTDYEQIVTAMPGGTQRRANVEMLLNKAADFEKTSFRGLFHFVRYIEHIKVVQVDYGEAGTIDENSDVVRIMSIHKSKGLEFPVVFVAGLSKDFDKRDTYGDLIIDMDLGIGVKSINTDLRVKYDTLKRRIIAGKIGTDNLGEEIRVLYVALTRAKEKLIMTSYVKNLAGTLESQLKDLSVLGAADEALPYSMRVGAGNYLSMVLPSLMLHPSMGGLLDKYELPRQDYDALLEGACEAPVLKISSVGDKDLLDGIRAGAFKATMRRQALENGGNIDEELLESLKAKFFAKYPHADLKGLFTKTTVSELKKKAMVDEDEFGVVPAPYAADEEPKGTLTGAERGSAYHRVMELLDSDAFADTSAEGLGDWIAIAAQKGLIPDEYREVVKPEDIRTYLLTDLGARMGAAFGRGELMREKPFMMGISAKELDPGFPEDEMVLVQGIVDAWFIENGEIVLLDYKTDKVRDGKALVDRYAVQLELYKRALEAATRKKVKEVYIYSFTLESVIRLD